MNHPNANRLINERLQEGLAQSYGTKVSPTFGLKLKDIPKVVRKEYGGLVRDALGGGFVNRYSTNVPDMGVYYAFVEPPTARDGHSEYRVSLVHYNSKNLYVPQGKRNYPEFGVLALVQTIEMHGQPGPHLNLAIAKIARAAAQSNKFPAGKIIYRGDS